MPTKDETKTTQTDTLDESSKGKDGSTSTPQTFDQKTQKKAVSDALAIAGRTSKVLDDRKVSQDAREQKIKDSEAKEGERIKARDAKELEDAKDDPEKLTIVQRNQKARNREIAVKIREEEAKALEAKNKTEIEAARATRFETDVWEIATKHKVDPAQLKEIGITDLKQLEGVAKVMSSAVPFIPDSGKDVGSGEKTEQQMLDAIYPTMKKS